MSNSAKVALIVGAGDAIGAAIVRRFAQEGLTVCAARRNAEKLENLIVDINTEGGHAHAFALDARKEDQVTALFERIENEIGELDVVVFNVGANVPMTMLDTPSKKFFKIWEMACFAGFLTGREAARVMQPRQRGTIIFTGATASMRGAAGFGAFASAKHGLRAIAQSLAREMGPNNIHVAHGIIDAAVDTAWIRENFPNVDQLPEDGLVNPASIAEHYVFIHNQPRDAWTFEFDLRPWAERW